MSLNPSSFQPTPYEPSAPAHFTPTQGTFKQLTPFRYWCQKVLPLVYDDSLSYYEVLCKVVDYLNKTMEDVDTLHTDVDNLHEAYEELEADYNDKYESMTVWINQSYNDLVTFVNTYFENLDVQEEINNKLDAMALDGTLTALIKAYIDPIYQAYETEINAQIAEQNTEIGIQNNKILILKERMDTFASLPDGSTAGDAEVIDGRIGADGIVYNSLGDSIRSQFDKLYGYLLTKAIFTAGYIVSSTAVVDPTEIVSPTSTDYGCCVINCKVGDTFIVNASGMSSGRLYCFCDKFGRYLLRSTANATETNKVLVAPEGSAFVVFNVRVDEVHEIYTAKIINEPFNVLKQSIYTNVPMNALLDDVFTEGYIVTSGATVDTSTIVSTATTKCYYENCSAGDCYSIKGLGGSSGRLYCFCDSSDNVLVKAKADLTLDNNIIIAPENTAYVVFNVKVDVPFNIYKGNLLKIVNKNIEKAKTNTEQNVYNNLGINSLKNDEFTSGYITTSGATVDTSTIVSSVTTKCYYENCSAGDCYSIKGEGASSGRLYCFCDSSNNVLVKANANLALNNDIIIAPENTAYVVFNVKVAVPYKIYKGSFLGLIEQNINESSKGKVDNIRITGFNNTIYSWWVYPVATHLEGIYNKNYYGFCDNKGNQGVISIDLDNGNIEKTVLYHGSADDHNAPSVNILLDGTFRVMVVCTSHGNENYHHVFISKSAEDISEFDRYDLAGLYSDGKYTYSQVYYLNGKWYMFSRYQYNNNFYWDCRNSSDGITWSEPELLISADLQYYCIFKPYDSTKFKVAMISGVTLEQTDIRLGYYDTVNDVMLNADGTSLGLNVGYSMFTAVISKASDHLRLYDITSGANNFILYARIGAGSSYETYLHNSSGEVLLPNQGTAFGSSYQNGACFLDDTHIALAIHSGTKWYMDRYEISGNSYSLVNRDDISSTNAIKLMRPCKMHNTNNRYIYNRGLFTSYSGGFTTQIKTKEF